MFKNRKEREEYVANKDNWEIIQNPNYFRIVRLKGTGIVRVEGFLDINVATVKPHWVTLAVYYTNKKGELDSVYSLSNTTILDKMKDE